jgi:phage terminase small subunit
VQGPEKDIAAAAEISHTRGSVTLAKVTPKQERFCQEYLVDLNATQAAIRSGYSHDSAASIGHENLRKPEIQKRLKELQINQKDLTLVTQEFVITRLVQLVDTCMSNSYSKWNPSAAVKALELLGKHQGMFLPAEVIKGAVERLARDSGEKSNDVWSAIRWMVQQHEEALLNQVSLSGPEPRRDSRLVIEIIDRSDAA